MNENIQIYNNQHGGDLNGMSRLALCAKDEIIDFSVNIHCDGTPEFLRAALFEAMSEIESYPSAHAEELKEIAAQYYAKFSIEKEQIVFGNGSNELIHCLSRIIKNANMSKVYIVEPAFSEYALGATKADLEIERLWYSQDNSLLKRPENIEDFEENLMDLDQNSALFIANPANPSGHYISRDKLLEYIDKRKDILWIIDEAFIEYVGEEVEVSILKNLPSNVLILRSLTKFHSLAGVRLGYLVTNKDLAHKIEEQLPAWTVNTFAIKATLAIFKEKIKYEKLQYSDSLVDNTESFSQKARKQNEINREHLFEILSNIDEITALTSYSNYILFKIKNSSIDLKTEMLKQYKIALRDCSNYHGLEDNSWYRVAVKTIEEHKSLEIALKALLSSKKQCSSHIKKRKRPALMIQGTSSDAGKSIIAAAFCRIFKQDGYTISPFKAQNMSLNSGVTVQGEEMGRAQIVQAQAAGVEPSARFNPVLLKPSTDVGSQVILCGKAIGHYNVKDYFEMKKVIWETVTNVYDDLAKDNDIIVLEGAGSSGEVNLKKHDIVNMRMAKHAGAQVLLVGDIDRGGVYASLLGTYMTFDSQERKLLLGYLINKFRGDPSLLKNAHDYILKHTKKPVLGTIPHIDKLGVPDEDMAGFSWTDKIDYSEVESGMLDVAVIMLRHVSNYTDISPLANEPDLRVRAVRNAEEFGKPHIVIIPGSKSVVVDLENLRENGLADKIIAHAKENKWLFGICGGLQIIGREIIDPLSVESDKKQVNALNLLDLSTQFEKEKTLIHIKKALSPLNISTKGYEIHHGITKHGKEVLPLFLRDDKEYSTHEDRICGYVKDKIWATYLHGVFDDDAFRRAFIDHVRQDLGLEKKNTIQVYYDLDKSLDNLAHLVREHTDMKAIYKALGL